MTICYKHLNKVSTFVIEQIYMSNLIIEYIIQHTIPHKLRQILSKIYLILQTLTLNRVTQHSQLLLSIPRQILLQLYLLNHLFIIPIPLNIQTVTQRDFQNTTTDKREQHHPYNHAHQPEHLLLCAIRAHISLSHSGYSLDDELQGIGV